MTKRLKVTVLIAGIGVAAMTGPASAGYGNAMGPVFWASALGDCGKRNHPAQRLATQFRPRHHRPLTTVRRPIIHSLGAQAGTAIAALCMARTHSNPNTGYFRALTVVGISASRPKHGNSLSFRGHLHWFACSRPD